MELIYCAAGNPRFAEIAIRHGFKYGAQLPATVYYPPYFADQNWKKPRYVEYVTALRRHRPHIASVLDWEHEHRFDEIMMRAEEISQYCNEVMIIPKVVGGVHRIPETINGKPVRLGYSVPTKYGGTTVPIEEFGRRPVHLLGGSPANQLALRGMNVVSSDGNYTQKMAIWGELWTGLNAKGKDTWRDLKDVYQHVAEDVPYIAFELSLINLKIAWLGVSAMIRFATNEDIPAIKAIANQYKQELGFVMLPALRKAVESRELHVIMSGDCVAGFVNWHKRKDGVAVIYEIAVHRDFRCRGFGKALVASVPGNVRLKCTTDNPANEFYQRIGFTCIDTENGRKRELNVWQRLVL